MNFQVAALYFLGMAGHFGLGNTNTLATIDVAGAFIVILLPLYCCFPIGQAWGIIYFLNLSVHELISRVSRATPHYFLAS